MTKNKTYCFALTLVILLAGLASCTNEVMKNGNTEQLPNGTTGIAIRMATSKEVTTRAPGDVVSVLTPEEKEVKSLAFFVDNKDGFKSFFSNKPRRDNKGFDEPLQRVADLDYTASIRILGDHFGASEVVLIANYQENGLAQELEKISSMEELKAKTISINNNATTPLLMYSAKAVSLNNGERLAEAFVLTRMVARVDIQNKAKGATPAQGFELKSARLVNAKKEGYLAAGATLKQVLDLPVDKDKSFSPRGVDPKDDARIDTLYTYENPNTDPATATAIELIGTFKSKPVVKLVKFLRINPTTKRTEPIAIQRNFRYLIEITPAISEHDVELNIKVKDWDEADTIPVKPTKEKPTIIYQGNSATSIWRPGGVGNQGIKTLDISEAVYTQEHYLTFTTVEQQECEAEVVALFGNKQNKNWLRVERTQVKVADPADPTAKVTSYFTVTIPAYTGANIGLRRAYIAIKNSLDRTKMDTIQVVQRIPYIANNAPAARLVKGIWWAPINVGATAYSISRDVSSSGNNTEYFGLLYQWGRKEGHVNSGSNNPVTTSLNPTQADLPTLDSDARWKGKFILASRAPFDTQNNWLLFQPGVSNPTGPNMVDDAWYQKLWNANEIAGTATTPKKTASDPCPDGWRVCTKQEFTRILGESSWNASTSHRFFPIDKGETGDPLIFPACGVRVYDDARQSSIREYGYYWSSSATRKFITADLLVINQAQTKMNISERGYAVSVRCVQE